MYFGSMERSVSAAVLEEPRGIAAQVPLRTDIGAGTQDDVEPLLLSLADVFGDIVLAGEVVDAGAWLVQVPEDVSGDGVQAHGAGLAEAIAPVGTRHAGVVHLAGEDLVGLVVKLELTVGDRKRVARGCGLSLDMKQTRYRQLARP